MSAGSVARARGLLSRLWPLYVGAVLLTAMIAGGFTWDRLIAPPAVPLPGTDLGARPSPDFQLDDHRGVPVALADFRGRPVVLTFLFASCPDVCLLMATGLRQSLERLGDQAAQVQVLAVSVDPAGDDPAVVRRFLARHDLTDRMLYLTGPRERLPEVWRAYHLFVSADPQVRQPGLDAHTDAIYLIDKQGRQRSLFRADFDPNEVADALARLAAEPS